MVKSSLIQSVSKLSRKEFERFLLFVKSPYYNNNEQVIELTEYLLLHFGKYNNENCDKETVYKHVYLSNQFNYVQLRRLFSTTLSLLEQMLVVEYRNKNELSGHLDLLNVLIDKKMNKRVEKNVQKVESILEDSNNFVHSDEYYLKYKLINSLDSWYLSQLNFGKSYLMQQKLDTLDTHYIIEKLFQSCGMINRERELEGRNKLINYKYPLVDQINQFIATNEYYKNEIALNVYHKIYKSLVDNDDEDNYFELCTLVEKHIDIFGREEGSDIYVNLINFAARKINQGKTHFFPHIFELQKIMLTHGFLMENGVLSHLSYQNLVTTALGLKEYDWALNFIEEYQTFLPLKIKSNAYNYNLAAYYCEISEYEKAHDLLVNIEYNNLMYNLNARAMLLRVYFETEEVNALEAHTSAFKVYLMRKKVINKDKYRRYYNLFRYTERVFKIKQDIPYEKSQTLNHKLDKLVGKIDTSGRLPFKRWLYKQTTAIKEVIS